MACALFLSDCPYISQITDHILKLKKLKGKEETYVLVTKGE
jgi:hypothetical protein